MNGMSDRNLSVLIYLIALLLPFIMKATVTYVGLLLSTYTLDLELISDSGS